RRAGAPTLSRSHPSRVRLSRTRSASSEHSKVANQHLEFGMDIKKEPRDASSEPLADIAKLGVRRLVECIFEPDRIEPCAGFRIGQDIEGRIARREECVRDGA